METELRRRRTNPRLRDGILSGFKSVTKFCRNAGPRSQRGLAISDADKLENTSEQMRDSLGSHQVIHSPDLPLRARVAPASFPPFWASGLLRVPQGRPKAVRQLRSEERRVGKECRYGWSA